MRNGTLRKSVYSQLLATFLTLILLFGITLTVNGEEIKPEIANALEKGDTALAINLLNQEIDLDKSYYLNYYTLGMIYYNQEHYNKAQEQFLNALDKKSKHYESLYYLGMTQLQLGDIEEAQKTFEKGIKKDKKEGYRFEDGLGLVYLEQKKYEDADKKFRQALIGDTNNALYHIHLGDANLMLGVPYLATTEYQKALELDTAGLEVYYHWAEACLDMKDYTCAMEKLKVVLQKDSTHAPSWRRAGGIYFKAALSSHTRDDQINRFKEAIGAYKKYLDLSGAQPDSAHVRVFFELAMSYSALNGFDDAVDYYEKVLAIPYVPRDIYFNYGKALIMTQKYEKGSEMLLKQIEWAAKQDPDQYHSTVKEYELYRLLGDSYYYRDPKDYNSAIEYYKKSLEDNPDQKRVVQNIALAYHNLKSYEQAFNYYVKRIEMGVDEKTSFLYKYAGNCALALAGSSEGSDEEDMEGDGEAATPIDPMEYYQAGADQLTKYLEFNPNDTGVVLSLASTYLHRLGDCANGVKYYEMVLTLDPSNCDAKKYLGYAYLTGEVCTKSYSKAITYLKEAYTCLSDQGKGCDDVGLVLGIAQSYHLRGADKANRKEDANDDYKAAFNWYGKVLKCDPNNADAKKGQDDLRFEFVE